MRELAVVFAISKSQVHRIVADLVPRLAALLSYTAATDRRWSWILDGTLVPTRDHSTAAKFQELPLVMQRAGLDPPR